MAKMETGLEAPLAAGSWLVGLASGDLPWGQKLWHIVSHCCIPSKIVHPDFLLVHQIYIITGSLLRSLCVSLLLVFGVLSLLNKDTNNLHTPIIVIIIIALCSES